MREKIAKNISFDTDKKLYYVRLYYGIVNGEKVEHYKTFKTQAEAEFALAEFIVAKGKNQAVVPSKMTMAELCEIWLAHKENDVELTT